jgi:hypothetical protein
MTALKQRASIVQLEECRTYYIKIDTEPFVCQPAGVFTNPSNLHFIFLMNIKLLAVYHGIKTSF